MLEKNKPPGGLNGGFTVRKESNNNTQTLGVACLLKACQPASTSKKPAKRGPKPKQISPSNYCRICGCWLYVDSIWQRSRSLKVSSRVKNHHFSKFAIFRRLNTAHQELSLKKFQEKFFFCADLWSAKVT